MKNVISFVGGACAVLLVEYIIVFHTTIPQQYADRVMARQEAALNEILKGMPSLPVAMPTGCSADGVHWFAPRQDGMCWSADAPR